MEEEKSEIQKALDRVDIEHMRIEGRVYSLEKEVQFLTNILALAAICAGYYLLRWYQENASSIPGVSA